MNRYLLIITALALSMFSFPSLAGETAIEEDDVLPFKSVKKVNPFLLPSLDARISAGIGTWKMLKLVVFDSIEVKDLMKKYLSGGGKMSLNDVAISAYLGANYPVNQYFSVGFKIGAGFQFMFPKSIENIDKTELLKLKDYPKKTQKIKLDIKKANGDTDKVRLLKLEQDNLKRDGEEVLAKITKDERFQTRLKSFTLLKNAVVKATKTTKLKFEKISNHSSMTTTEEEIYQKYHALEELSESIGINSEGSPPLFTIIPLTFRTFFSIPFKFTYPVALGLAGDISPFLSLDCGIQIASSIEGDIIKFLNIAYARSKKEKDSLVYSTNDIYDNLLNRNFLYEKDIIAYIQPTVGVEYYPIEWVGLSVGYMLPTFNMSLNSAFKKALNRTAAALDIDTAGIKDEFYDIHFANYYGTFTFGLHVTF
ncbi:MAG: hypothetical protein K9G11_04655 [Rickettsiaceae bacterium]|nr:hypothetical protein [Rickettsiaceae bacterium]